MGELTHIRASPDGLLDVIQSRADLVRAQVYDQLVHDLRVAVAQHRTEPFDRDLVVAIGRQLIQQANRVSCRPGRRMGDELECAVRDFDALLVGDVP